MKKKEDGDGNVLRLYDISGKDTSAQITLFGKTVCVSVPRNGLKTVDDHGRELDAMEWEI